MTDSYLIGHYNFLGIFENLCQDLQTINFYVRLWGSSLFYPNTQYKLHLNEENLFSAQRIEGFFLTRTSLFLSCPRCPRLHFLYFDTNSNIVPFFY